MRLSLTARSFPSSALPESAAISRAPGIGTPDPGLFQRSAPDKAAALADPQAVATRETALGVSVPDCDHPFGNGPADRSLARPRTDDANARDLDRMPAFADAAGKGSGFLPRGIVNRHPSRDDAARVATESLPEPCGVASHHPTRPGGKPHAQPRAGSPAPVRRPVDDTGLGLALDSSHFACLGHRRDEVDPLAPQAVDVHLRQARKGLPQTKFVQGALTFPAIFATPRDAGHDGRMAPEAVHQDGRATLTEDVLTETIALCDCRHAWKEAA